MRSLLKFSSSILIVVYALEFILNINDISVVVPILFILGIPFIMKCLKWKVNEKIVVLLWAFIYLSFGLGSIHHFYFRYWWYDTFVHFLTGVVGNILAITILVKENIEKKIVFSILFLITFSMFLASSWEILEYFSDILFKTDSQWVQLEGIHDTMIDMIATLVGSILSLPLLYFKINGGKNEKRKEK